MIPMKFAALAALITLAAAVPAYAASEADCKAMFEKADMNKDSTLAQDEADGFVKAMTGAGTKPKDATMMSMDEFMSECSKGTFDKMSN
ncbi:hypothetical protein BH10PSE7_BH10PSE7_34420 [soil metagenome]